MTQVYNITPLAKRLLIAVPIWVLGISFLAVLTKVHYIGGAYYGETEIFIMAFPYGLAVLLNVIFAWSWPLFMALSLQVAVSIFAYWEDLTLSSILNPLSWYWYIMMAVVVAATGWARGQIPWRLQILWRHRK